MNDFQFASSLVGSLAWPLVVVILFIIFRNQVAALIGRIKSYKGLGQELTFGDRLAETENSVEEAINNPALDQGDLDQIDKIEPNPLAREAEANPSFVVIRAWEQVRLSLDALTEVGLTKIYWKVRSGPNLITELRKANLINDDTAEALKELRDLRNSVAHGYHNPTPGEAIAYAESAQSISTFVRMKAEIVSATRDDSE